MCVEEREREREREWRREKRRNDEGMARENYIMAR